MTDFTALVGLAPEQLTFAQQQRADGLWVALRLYSPATLPLRKIEAVGQSPAEALAALAATGQNPAEFEAVRLRFLR